MLFNTDSMDPTLNSTIPSILLYMHNTRPTERRSSPVSDPYDICWSGLHHTTEFYAYRDALRRENIANILTSAVSESSTHDRRALMGTERLEAWDGNVQLILFPREGMTWSQWNLALWSMEDFVRRFDMCYE